MGGLGVIVSLCVPDFHAGMGFCDAATWCLKVFEGAGCDLLGVVRWAIFRRFDI